MTVLDAAVGHISEFAIVRRVLREVMAAASGQREQQERAGKQKAAADAPPSVVFLAAISGQRLRLPLLR